MVELVDDNVEAFITGPSVVGVSTVLVVEIIPFGNDSALKVVNGSNVDVICVVSDFKRVILDD